MEDYKKLGVRTKSKKKKGSLGFTGGASGSVSNLNNRVVMLCDDIPSEGSSWDSGQGSHYSGVCSSSEELAHRWSSRCFPGREARSTSSSARPTKQYPVQEIHHLESSPLYGQNAGRSTLCIRELYDTAATVVLCTYCICLLYHN